MITIAKHHQRCCICCLGDTNIDALHEIEKRLISSSRATGKPQFRKLAREFMHLWPDKEGQTQAQKEDVLRKTLQTHVKHIAEKIQEAREEERGHVADLSEMAEEFLYMVKINVEQLQKAAKKKGADPKLWLCASQAAIPASNLLGRLAVPEKKSESTTVNINLSKLSTEELETYARLRAKLEGSEEGTSEEKAA